MRDSLSNKRNINKIRSLSASAEKSKCIPADWLKFIYSEKLFKLFIPKEAGGLMLSLPNALRVFDEAAFIDGNFGWAVTIGSGGGYFYGYIKPAIAKKLFSPKNAVVAGSGAPTGTAKIVKGGYKVTGKWAFCSGAPYATIFTANVLINGKEKKAFAFAPEQVKITKDWDAFGMKATESHSISVNDGFVPSEMTFDLSVKEPLNSELLYKYPFLQFAETSFASLTIGLCRHFFEVAKEMMNSSRKKWEVIPGRYEFVKDCIAKNEKEFNKALMAFYDIADKSWSELVKNGKINAKTLNEVSRQSKKVSRVILRSSDDIIQYMGMGAIMESADINRIWRDIHTACQHVLLVPYGN